MSIPWRRIIWQSGVETLADKIQSLKKVLKMGITYMISSVTSDIDTLPSDGSQSATLSALIDSATPGITVTWTVSTGPGKVSPLTSVTDATGLATTALTASAIGTISVSATTADDATGKSVNVAAANLLYSPDVLNASAEDDYTLSDSDLNFGVWATIPRYKGAKVKDQVTFYWGGVGSTTFPITDVTADLPKDIDVTDQLPPECLQEGTYSVSYTAVDASGNSTNSVALRIKVSTGNTPATLPEPTVPEATRDVINVDIAADGVDVDVAYSLMTAGDYITLFWEGEDDQGNKIDGATTSQTYTVVEGDVSHTFSLEKELFYPNGMGYEGQAVASYTVHVPGSDTDQKSIPLTLQVDTVPPGSN